MYSFESIEGGEEIERRQEEPPGDTDGDKYEVNEGRKLEQGDRWGWRERLKMCERRETLRA